MITIEHSLYETLRQIADSWALVAMAGLFLVLVAWPFRPGMREKNNDAANMIFKDENDG